NAHVRQNILIVGERPLTQGAGVMALVAVHGEDFARGEGVLVCLRVGPRPWLAERCRAPRHVDRQVVTAPRPAADQRAEEGNPASRRPEESGWHDRIPSALGLVNECPSRPSPAGLGSRSAREEAGRALRSWWRTAS